MILPEKRLFVEKARACFEGFLAGMGYVFGSVEEAGTVVRVYFRHRHLLLVFIVENNWYKPDYGFTVYLHHTGLQQQNVLYNTPPERQDAACVFVFKAATKISCAVLPEGLLAGRFWQRLGFIFFRD